MFSRDDIVRIILPIIATIIGSYIFAKKRKSLGNVFVFGIITFIASSFIYYILCVK
jgi:hypothetical protein